MENIPDDEEDFDGKVGDIILGGGNGEVAAFRISIPETLYFFTSEDRAFENLVHTANYLKLFGPLLKHTNYAKDLQKLVGALNQLLKALKVG